MHDPNVEAVAVFNEITRVAMFALSFWLLVGEWRNKRRWHRLSLLTTITFATGISVITGLGPFTPDEWVSPMRILVFALMVPSFIGLVFYALYARKYPDLEPEGDHDCDEETD